MLHTFFKKNIPKTLLLVLVLCASAQVSFDVGTIPVTAQSFVVTLLAFVLALGWALAALGIYTALGLIGLPVFADGAHGWVALQAGSAGYFVGFAAGCIVLHYYKKNAKPPHIFLKNTGAMAAATFVILLCGTGYLVCLYPFGDALRYGFYPFIPGGLIKSLVAAAVVTYLNHAKA
jgi:biotin transport system substrate-specific component